MEPATFRHLLEKYLQDDISPGELSIMLADARKEENQAVIKEMLDHKLKHPGLYHLKDDNKISQMFDRMVVKAKAEQNATRRFHLMKNWQRYAAAVLLLIAGGGIYLYMARNREARVTATIPVEIKDVAPGADGAILTLADGTSIILDSLDNGTITTQNGVRISLKKGQLTYHDMHSSSGEVIYNTITTPRGRQFGLVLEDGTKVWLNAASSIRFPTLFNENTRRVEIEGEAFLEIAKNSKQPFKVKARGTEIQVLGTSFNVNAYNDERSVKTTLVEGSIKVHGAAEGKEMLLKPGEQVTVSADGNMDKENSVDVETAMGWKNGLFYMKNADLPLIMRQIARWYDLQIEFEGRIPEGAITGEVPRSMHLQKVLEVIKASGIDVTFRRAGGKLIITQND